MRQSEGRTDVIHFGGDTGVSYEQLQRRRAIADQLMAQNSRTPRNAGEGLQAVANALVARRLNKKADARETELNEQFKASVDGMNIDPTRRAILAGMSVPQQQAYLLNYLDRRDTRRGGSSKADLQAARDREVLASFLGGDQSADPSVQTPPDQSMVIGALKSGEPLEFSSVPEGGPSTVEALRFPEAPQEPTSGIQQQIAAILSGGGSINAVNTALKLHDTMNPERRFETDATGPQALARHR